MKTPIRTCSSLFPAIGLVLGLSAPAQQMPEDRSKGAAAVTLEQTKTWLYKLASEEFAGRGTGQEGFRLAAEYMRDQFRDMGLRPSMSATGDANDQGSYFQTVPWSATKVDMKKSSLTFSNSETKLVIPGDRLSGTISGSLDMSGEVALVTDPADLEDSEVAGKIVVVVIDSTARSGRRGGAQFQVMRALQGKDQKGLLFAQKEPITRPLAGRSGAIRGNRAMRGARRFPGAIAFGGKDLDALMQMAGAAPDAEGVRNLDIKADLRVVAEDKGAPAFNVIGILPGADPELRDEYVVIGSHLDHLGERNGEIYYGADDDASGTTGVLAVAKMFTENPTKPRRSILFVGFCGEERGLIGSAYFVDNSPIPLSSIVGELQLDMIGRDEEANSESRGADRNEKAEDNRNTLHLVGTQKLSPELHEVCMNKNEVAGFELEWDQEGMFGRSDHANFARYGVPVAFFFTGLHRDYHRPTDTPDKIHFEKLLRVATYVYDIAFELAQMDGRPEIDPKLWQAYRGKRQQQPAAPMKGGK